MQKKNHIHNVIKTNIDAEAIKSRKFQKFSNFGVVLFSSHIAFIRRFFPHFSIFLAIIANNMSEHSLLCE